MDRRLALAKRFAALGSRARRELESKLAAEGVDVWSLPIPPSETARIDGPACPLSPAQERIVLAQEWTPDAATYQQCFAFRLRGPLDLGLFQRTWAALVERHPMLRLRIERSGDDLLQRVTEAAPELSVRDASRLSGPEREQLLRDALERAARERMSAFDRALVEAELIRLAEVDHAFILRLHHAASDGWSLGILVRDLCALYAAMGPGTSAGEASEQLPQPAINYVDFTLWQRRWLESEAAEEQLAHWLEVLSELGPEATLPADLRTSNDTPAASWSCPRNLDPELARAIREQCRREGATLYMFLLATLQLLIARHTGIEDVRVGSSVAHRPRPETDGLVGCFVNTLVMRGQLGCARGAGVLTVRSWLQHVRERVLDAIAHQDLPLERVMDGLAGRGAGSTLAPAPPMGERPKPAARGVRQRPFQVFFALLNAPAERVDVGELGLEPLPLPHTAPAFELALRANETRDGAIALSLELDANLFERDTGERLLRHFEAIARELCTAPDRSIESWGAIDRDEQAELIRARQPRRLEAASDVELLPDRIARAAREHPERIAVRDAAGGALSYAELVRHAQDTAQHMRARGLHPGDLVEIQAQRSVHFLVAVLATWIARAHYVPLEPDTPEARAERIRSDARPRLRITTEGDLLGFVEPRRIEHENSASEDTQPEGKLSRDPNLDQTRDLPRSGAEIAYRLYTSGSTGTPKPVHVNHGQLAHYLTHVARRIHAPEQAVHAAVSSLAADLALTTAFGAFYQGGTAFLIEPDVALHTDRLAALFESVGTPDVLKITPAQMRVWLDAQRPGALIPKHTLVFGGQALDQKLVRSVRRLRPEVRVLNHYGPTETTVGALTHEVEATDTQGQSRRPVPLGTPLDCARAYILDAHAQLLPDRVPGELYIGGDSVADGYADRPRETALRFLPDPFAKTPGARVYRTGDRAVYDAQKQIVFLGRCDHQISLHGVRIEPEEVEAALRTLPGIRDAAVTTASERENQDHEPILVACLLPEATDPPIQVDNDTIGHWRNLLRQQIPEVMIPARFLCAEELPKNANLKLDRQRLERWALQRLRELDATNPDQAQLEHVEPTSDLERTLADIWTQVLGTKKPIGITDDFFALGGDSILSLQIIARARRAGIAFTPKQLFENPTVQRLAPLVKQIERQPLPPNTPTGSDQPAEAPVWPSALRELYPDLADAYPLSPLQQGILFHALEAPDSGVYVNQLSGTLPGTLDLDALRRTWDLLTERHPVLRTCFVWEGEGIERPLQCVLERAEIPIEYEDWSVRDPERAEADWAERLRTDLASGFVLDRAPLMRMQIIRTGPNSLRFLWTRHHLLLDGWSSARLLQEFALLYTALASRAEPPALPPTPPYRRYIEWLEARHSSSTNEAHPETTGAAEADRTFWQQALEGFDEPSLLTTSATRGSSESSGDMGGPTAAVPTPRWRSSTQTLGVQLTESLRRVASEAGLTPHTILQGAWALILARATGRDDVVFGVTVAGRPVEIPDVEQILGLFINTVPMRVRTQPARTRVDWLRQLQHWNVTVREHEHTPLAEIARSSELAPGTPLFDTLFVYENYPIRSAVTADSSATPQAVTEPPEPRASSPALALGELSHVDRTNYPVTLVVSPHGDDLDLELAWDASRTRELDPARALDRLRTVVAQLVAQPRATLGSVELQSASELAELAAWNQTRAPIPPLAVHREIQRQAELTPNAVAVRFERTEVSYAELAARANQLARLLHAHGVGTDDRIAVCMERSIELVVALLGILEAGAAYVPLDPEAPPLHHARVLADSGARAVLTHAPTRDRVGVESTRSIDLDLETDTLSHQATDPLGAEVHPDQLAYVIYTSGSTGAPKGAALPHRGLANRIAWMQDHYRLTPADRVLQKTPYTFDVSVWEFFWTLREGACLVMARPGGHRDPAYLSATIRTEQITTIHFVPSMLRAWLEDPAVEKCESLRHIFASGEALPSDLVTRLEHTLPRPLHNLYGPTEASIDVTAWECVRGSAAPPPIGRPIANTTIHVVDAWLHPVGIDLPGELCIGGVGLARGYIGDPRRTALVFVPDPQATTPGARLYRTGDLARWRFDGSLDYLGRIDAQIKLHGQRIEPGEIEAALLLHPQIREAVVVLRSEATGARRLLAYVTAEAGRVELASVRAHLAARLPAHMLPSLILALDELPRTPSGKLDRKALPAPESSPIDSQARPPESDAERLLAELWCEVLAIDSGRVTRSSNFFELGGDSILSLQLVARVRRAGFELHPRDVFEHPTLEDLASSLRTPSPRQQHAPVGPPPLTPIQAWFFEQDLPERAHWNQALMLEVPAGFDSKLLAQAWQVVASVHDVFRFRFAASESEGPSQADGPSQIEGPSHLARPARSARVGGWRQTRVPDGALPELTVVDGRRWPRARRRDEIEAWAQQQQRSLDLEHGPLICASYIDLGDDDPGRLLLVAHHLIVDGVSWRVLLDDWIDVVLQLMRGSAPSLDAPPVGFADWAHELARVATDGELEAQRDYWLEQTSRPPAKLPHDRESGANTVGSARTHGITLDRERTRSLLEQSHIAYRTTLDDLLISALTRALASWFERGGQRAETLAIELEGHGRESSSNELDLSRTLGWFTTRYPVCFELDPRASAREHLLRVKETLRAIPNKGRGYGILRYLAAEPLSHFVPPISYNYLGQLDRGQRAEFEIRPATESLGSLRSPRGLRTQELDVSAYVLDQQLHLSCAFSTHLHAEDTIARLLEDVRTELERLLDHCCDSHAGALTPSDVPLAGLDAAELDQLFGDARGIEDVLPVSATQAGILFHSMYHRQSFAYHERLDFALRGDLEVAAFEDAWRQTVARHSILRTSFRVDAPRGPLQVVRHADACPLELAFMDWRSLSPDEREHELAQQISADQARGFHLDHAPLLRVTLIQLEDRPGRFAVLASHHHAITDGWSVALILREVLERYRARVEARAPKLPQAAPYRRYVEWLHEARQAPARDAAEDYWRKTLAGFARATPLPGAPDPTAPVGYAEQSLLLSRDASDALRAWARTRGLTLSTVFQGAWVRLLARHAGSDDVVIGRTSSGRPSTLPDAEGIVGPFIQTLPLRCRLLGDRNVSDWLAELQAEAVEQLRYEASSLLEAQAASDVPAGEPLFTNLFVFENYPVDASLRAAVGDLTLEPLYPEAEQRRRGFVAERNHYPLTLVVHPEERIGVVLAHDRRAIAASAVADLARRVELLIHDLCDTAEIRVAAWLGLHASEQMELVQARQPQQVADACDVELLPDRLARAAREHPERIAVRDAAGNHLSYLELLQRAQDLAQRMRARGLRPGDLVEIEALRSVHFLVAVVGTWIARAHYVPLEPDTPAARAERIRSDARPRLRVSTETAELDLVDPQRLEHADEPHEDPNHDTSRDLPRSGCEIAYRLYTSGSTGTPKPVHVNHSQLAHYLTHVARRIHAPEHAVHAAVSSLAADLALTTAFGAFYQGGTAFLIEPDTALHTDRLEAVFRATGTPDVLKITPAQMRVWLDAQNPAALIPKHTLVFGGQALDRKLVEGVRRLRPEVRVLNHYGPTETTVGALTYALDEPDSGNLHREPASQSPSARSVPLGTPLDSARAYILDPQAQLLPDQVPGELYIGGDSVANGYAERPRETALRFLPDPFAKTQGARMYRTGDRVVYDARKQIVFLGRCDHQISLHGVRIEPEEVEAALRSLPGIRDAAVTTVSDLDSRSEHAAETPPSAVHEPSLIACLVPEATGRALQIDTDTLELWRSLLRQQIPDVMIPARFLCAEQLPKNANLKLDRERLERWAREHLRDLDTSDAHPATPEFIEPTSDVERKLADIWRQVLDSANPIGITDDFFALGGDSILSLQIIARARREGITFTPKQLFENPTVQRLAPLVREIQTHSKGHTTEPVQEQGSIALFPIQRWFFELEPAELHHFNQAIFLSLPATTDVERLEYALERAVHEHAALRTRFELRNGHWHAEIAQAERDRPALLERLDLAATPDDELSSAITHAAARCQASLDLASGSLLRALYVDCGRERSARLLVVVHHLAIDAVSWRILLDTVARELSRPVGSRPTPPIPAPVSLRDVADTFERWGREGRFEAELPLWLERPHFELPRDADAPNIVGNVAHVEVGLDEERTRCLLEELPAQQRTQTDDVVLCALGRVLACTARTADALIECEGHGRSMPDEELDVSSCIGWFTTRWPLALMGVGHESDPLERLRNVKSALRRVPNGGLGYMILRHSSPHRERLAELAQPVVSYNNLGQVTRGVRALADVQTAAESPGPTRSPAGRRACLLDVTVHVAGGRLRISFAYAAGVHREDTIRAIAQETLREVQELIDRVRGSATESWVPEDLPQAQLDRAELDDLMAEIEEL